MKNFNKIALTALLTLTFTVAAQARSRPGTRSPEAGKGKIKTDAAKELSRKQGTAANAKTVEDSTSASTLDTALNLLVEKNAVDAETVMNAQAAVKSIKDANLLRDVETAINGLSSKVENSSEVQSFVKTALDFAASVKGVEGFRKSNEKTQSDREVMLTLLETLPKAMSWEAGKKKNFEAFLTKIVEGKENLQVAINKALEDAKITREELLRKCRA